MKYRSAFPAASIRSKPPGALPGLLPLVQRRAPPRGLGLHTAANIHYGRAGTGRAARANVLTAAYTNPSERFVRKPPAPPAIPDGSWINPPQQKERVTQ
jgi:hypothetical protein